MLYVIETTELDMAISISPTLQSHHHTSSVHIKSSIMYSLSSLHWVSPTQTSEPIHDYTVEGMYVGKWVVSGVVVLCCSPSALFNYLSDIHVCIGYILIKVTLCSIQDQDYSILDLHILYIICSLHEYRGINVVMVSTTHHSPTGHWYCYRPADHHNNNIIYQEIKVWHCMHINSIMA